MGYVEIDVLTRLKCPIENCGKEYRSLPGINAGKRLSHHLTGKHCVKDEAYRQAMEEAIKRALEEETT